MANLNNRNQKNNIMQVCNGVRVSGSQAKTYETMKLKVISNRVLLYELKSDTTTLLRKKAIVNALKFAEQVTKNTGGLLPFYFADNEGTGLIHVITEQEGLSFHPAYIFNSLTA